MTSMEKVPLVKIGEMQHNSQPTRKPEDAVNTLIKTTTMVSNNEEPPEIPHITTNMVPLNILLERVAFDTYRRFKEFFKFLESGTKPDVEKKKQFLEMLVSVRENFVRLYVICKWAKNHEEISKLIDLFVWLREQNERISNTIMSFGGIKSSLISAKMPEPDLLTSLEVLLQGRPNLPTYNFIPKGKLSAGFVLKVLQNLNVELSIKMSLLDKIPKPFQSFIIKDGCIHFDVPNYFSSSLSMLCDTKLHLIDLNLGFALSSDTIVKSTIKSDPQTLHTIQSYSDRVLESEGLEGLYDLLYNYAITSKIHLIHKQLVKLRMGLWRGHLIHNYNAENSSIVITYWVQKKYTNPSTIQIGKFKNKNNIDELSFKWFKDGVLDDTHDLKLIDGNDGSINILELINSIIKRHIQSIILQLKQSLVDSIEEVEKFIILSNNSEKLTFKISQFKFITYSVDPLSGSCYFENPSNTMNRSAFKINKGNSLNFVEILKLKMSIEESEFSSMMNATGWVNLKSVRLNNEEIPKLKINYSNLKNKNLQNILTSISIYRRKDWPIGWAIFVGHFGFQPNVLLWCCKIQSIEAQWSINWCSEIKLCELNESSAGLSLNSTFNIKVESSSGLIKDKEEEKLSSITSLKQNSRNLSYDDLINLVKISSSKLISNLIVKELRDEGCELKVLNSGDKLVNDFLLLNFKIDNTNFSSTDNAILLIKNKSFFNIQSSNDSLVLLISIKNSDLNAKIYGQITNDNSSKNIPDINYHDENLTHIEYDSNSRIFKIESDVDLSHHIGSVYNANVFKEDNLILSNILSFLKKFAKTLNLLKLVSSDPSLKIIKVLSDAVTFKYGENENEFISMKMSSKSTDNIIIEFPQNNPHLAHSEYLNEILSNGPVNNTTIKELVLYLTLTLKYCRKIEELTMKTKKEWILFNEKNENVDYELNPTNLQIIPSFGYLPFVSNIESFRLTYFKSIKLDVLQTTGKKKNIKFVSDVLKFEILVELRHRISRVSKKHSKFFISLGDMRTETTGSISSATSITETCGEGQELIALLTEITMILKNYFNGQDFPMKLKSGSVVFLNDGLCCDFENIDEILDDLHTRLYEVINPKTIAGV
jgi:mediator of RNA polymerase II transcription subunit 14